MHPASEVIDGEVNSEVHKVTHEHCCTNNTLHHLQVHGCIMGQVGIMATLSQLILLEQVGNHLFGVLRVFPFNYTISKVAGVVKYSLVHSFQHHLNNTYYSEWTDTCLYTVHGEFHTLILALLIQCHPACT